MLHNNMTTNKDFLYDKHVGYIQRISRDKESFEFVVTEHLRMSGVYWGLTAMAILGRDLKTEMDSSTVVDWVMSCYDPVIGGFGGNVGHDVHMLYTLSALQILLLCDEIDRVDKDRVAAYISSLQQEDGSFAGDCWGEIDTRFSYCGLYALAILGRLHSGIVDIQKAVSFIERCKNFDGGFGAVPGAESHAAQVFCCVAALSIVDSLDVVDHDLLGWWLSERQCDSGGLNGRPEKQADVCYSWWILSCMSILGRVSWIDKDKLVSFILSCQDDDAGGLSDQAGNMADIFHTFFGICGLSLLNYFSEFTHPADMTSEAAAVGAPAEPAEPAAAAVGGSGGEQLQSVFRLERCSISRAEAFASIRHVDPTFALPRDVVAKYGMRGQTHPAL